MLCAITLVGIVGIGIIKTRQLSISFNPETEGILDVVAQTAYGESKQTKFYSISAQGSMEISGCILDAMDTWDNMEVIGIHIRDMRRMA